MRNSIYFSRTPLEARADLLLEFDKHFFEVWCHVPCTEKRYSDLRSICRRVSEKFDSPGLFDVLHYYDVLGDPHSVFHNTKLAPGLRISHSLGVFYMHLPAWRGYYEHSRFMECITELVREIEKTYNSGWLVDIRKSSDSMYIRFAFNDDAEIDPAVLDPDRTMPGNNLKFLCGCGQFRGRSQFRSRCDFAFGPNGRAGAGFYYNDSRLNCADYVSLGGGVFFKNMGYVDCGYVSDRHSGYSYYVRARNLDEKKVNVLPRIGCSREKIYEPSRAFGSIEEFALERAAAGGLRLGDACYLYCTVISPEGEKRSVSCTACWDGSKWIDYDRETEIEDWPELKPGWKVA